MGVLTSTPEERAARSRTGALIRAARRESRLTQKQLAKAIGMGPMTLCGIELGDRGLRPQEAAAIKKHLGVEVEPDLPREGGRATTPWRSVNVP